MVLENANKINDNSKSYIKKNPSLQITLQIIAWIHKIKLIRSKILEIFYKTNTIKVKQNYKIYWVKFKMI
jgi:hypothetical protein